MADALPLHDRFARAIEALGLASGDRHVLVALSGGCDSVVLLHLFQRVSRDVGLTVSAAHLDHAMREGSAEDARWVTDLCASWRVPLIIRRLDEPPRSEAAARAARYEFLRQAAAEAGADLIATAHTADDQAETVLFRAVRGTGLRGLAGIRARTRSGIVRPMLGVWRAEVEEHARRAGLTWREDPSNAELRYARNRIRNELLPEMEATFAPAARRMLVSLAAQAASAEAALDRLARRAAADLARREGDAWLVDRVRLRDYDPAVGTRMLRNLLRRLGPLPGRAGTQAALKFITDASSGREMQLPGGLRIRTEFGEARLEVETAGEPDIPLELGIDQLRATGPLPLRIGGARYRVEVFERRSAIDPDVDGWTVALDPSLLGLPLRLRGWRPGDRVSTPAGTKPLKKLFLEERISRSRRAELPVLTDAAGRVLWVAGLRRPIPIAGGEETLFLKIMDD